MKQFALISILSAGFAICSLAGCTRPALKQRLHSLHLIDQGDLGQMITHKGRLRQWERRNIKAPQPYKKIMRTFARDDQGRQRGEITSYYPNGQLMQSLETCDGRAFGTYREWFDQGQLRLDAKVAGGMADLTPDAQIDWLFEGVCSAWDENGRKAALIYYRKGLREGAEQHFWPNGALRRESIYVKGRLQGEMREFDENGRLSLTVHYQNGERSGPGICYWPSGQLAWSEMRDQNCLIDASYWDPLGTLVARVRGGSGWRAVFDGEGLAEKQHFEGGLQSGAIEYFDHLGFLTRRAHFDRGILNGIDTEFFKQSEKSPSLGDSRGKARPRLQVTWVAGTLQGPVQTWFADGQLRTYHDRMQNKREGICTHYYPDGQIKLVEHYRADRLDQGQYYGHQEVRARSAVFNGKGMASLFDDSGAMIEQIAYEAGAPVLIS